MSMIFVTSLSFSRMAVFSKTLVTFETTVARSLALLLLFSSWMSSNNKIPDGCFPFN